jgi:60S ribosome subunit biogenesis protein NIP7
MRPLTQKEAQLFFEKLAKFVGANCESLLTREGENWTFQEHHGRVYYMRESMAPYCKPFAHKQLLSAGVCMGKFTKKGRFFVHITALPLLAPLAQYKVWVKASAEIPFLYGQHILKEGVENMTEGTPRNAGVIVFNKDNLAIGLGVALQSSVSLRMAMPTIMAVARQGDLGEYLRSENTIA